MTLSERMMNELTEETMPTEGTMLPTDPEYKMAWLTNECKDPRKAADLLRRALYEDRTLSPVQRNRHIHDVLSHIARAHNINLSQPFDGLHVDARDNHPGPGPL